MKKKDYENRYKALRLTLSRHLDWQRDALNSGDKDALEYVNQRIKVTRDQILECQRMLEPSLKDDLIAGVVLVLSMGAVLLALIMMVPTL